MAVREEQADEAVRINVASLVRLNRYAASIPLRGRRVMARQGGNYLSPFRGRGMEFDESRLYLPGDDIRNIDWRVTARTGKVHTKLFREERERPVFLWLDLRASMHFATRRCFKAVQASRLAALIAWSAVHHGDRVGAVLFSEEVHHELKPRRGRAGALQLINQLAAHPAWQDGNTAVPDNSAAGRALIRLRRVARPGSLIFLISDFRHLDESAETQLLHLARHNDVAMIHVYDILEEQLPPPGRYRLTDGEQEILLDTADKERVQQYRQRFHHHLERLTRLARKGNIHLLACTTEDDPLAVLKSGLGAE
ncbi:MAG: DUF58 domain-containing protein [Gammaproteobacteria bacterium]